MTIIKLFIELYNSNFVPPSTQLYFNQNLTILHSTCARLGDRATSPLLYKVGGIYHYQVDQHKTSLPVLVFRLYSCSLKTLTQDNQAHLSVSTLSGSRVKERLHTHMHTYVSILQAEITQSRQMVMWERCLIFLHCIHDFNGAVIWFG